MLGSQPPFRPAHAKPAMRALSLPELALKARRNVLETIPVSAYHRPIVSGKTIVRWHHVMEPAALKRIFLDNVENYPKSQTSQRLLRPAIGASIFTSEGDEWRWQRRAAAPVFATRKLDALAPMMTAAAERAAERLDAAIAGGFEGRATACVMHEMVTATFDVVCDALLAGGESGEEVGLDRAQVGADITRYLETIGRISLLDILNAPNWVPRPAQVLNRDVMDKTVAQVDRLIARRRAEADDGAPREDLLGFMLAAADPETGQRMDDATLRNNLLAFIVAGHETTALALAWSLYLLANAPEAQTRAAQEALNATGGAPATAAHLPALAYTRQVLDEAMRLFPPAAMIGRQAKAADTLCGVRIEPEDLVIVSIYALHRNALYWPDPHGFDPENFAAEAVKGRDRYLYLPFGAGPRVCIGMGFALMEAQIILATLLPRFRFDPRPGPAPEPVLTMTLRPKGGMPLRVRRR